MKRGDAPRGNRRHVMDDESAFGSWETRAQSGFARIQTAIESCYAAFKRSRGFTKHPLRSCATLR